MRSILQSSGFNVKNKLSIQVGIIVSLFLAALLITVEVVLFTSTQSVYLDAKDDMLKRDLNAMYSEMTVNRSMAGLMKYWQEEREMLKAKLSEEELDYLMSFTGPPELGWYSAEQPDEYLDTMKSIDPVYFHDIMDMMYYIITNQLQTKFLDFGYDELYLMDISEGGGDIVLISMYKDEDLIVDMESSHLGERPRIDLSGTKAAEKLRSGSRGDIAFDIITDDEGTPYYAGYILVAPKDDHRYALCLLFNWAHFRDMLYHTISAATIISSLLIVIANILLIRFLYIRAIKPVTEIQKSVRGYTVTKDTARITKELSEITTKNEFGALAGDVSHLAEEMERYTTESARLAAELDLAAHIQASQLPGRFPAFPDRKEFDLFASMIPAKEVGGDFYDFFLIGEDKLALVIADVSGKGVPAALFMMSSKILIADYALAGYSPSKIIGAVNDRICQNNEDMMFVTVWLGILEISTGKLTCCNAGHQYPAIKKANGKFGFFDNENDICVGIMPGVQYNDYVIQLAPGDTVFVYTDGVPEANDGDNRLYGEDRMIEALNSAQNAPPEELLRTLKSDVDAFVGDAPQFDDLTMLALLYSGDE